MPGSSSFTFFAASKAFRLDLASASPTMIIFVRPRLRRAAKDVRVGSCCCDDEDVDDASSNPSGSWKCSTLVRPEESSSCLSSYVLSPCDAPAAPRAALTPPPVRGAPISSRASSLKLRAPAAAAPDGCVAGSVHRVSALWPTQPCLDSTVCAARRSAVVKIGIGAGKDGPPRTQARRERTNQPRSPLITQTQDAVPRHRSATTPPSP
mmetsp:Transcript_4676/g.17314  ORF Transcript_4676/g.17314 Transcript_4676/m.17314 type:complete len:208 (+) Transcript_4676:3087-3710(+)